MSILIKGISSLKEGLYQVQDGKIHAYKGNGGEVQEFDLVEVPTPHGRLVDEDRIRKVLIHTLEALKKSPKMDRQEMHLIAAFSTLGKMLDEALTIIEAEEGAEE